MILLKLEMTNVRDLQLLTIPDLIQWPKLPVELEVSTIGQHTFKSLNQLCEAANFHSDNVAWWSWCQMLIVIAWNSA